MCNCKKTKVVAPEPTPIPIPEELKDQFITEPTEIKEEKKDSNE